MATPTPKATPKGNVQSEEIASLRQQIAELTLQIQKLHAANAMQNVIDSGLDTISQHTELIRELAPDYADIGKKISRSLARIAEHTEPTRSYARPDKAQREQLKAIAGQHPRLDFASIDYLKQWPDIVDQFEPGYTQTGARQ